MNRAAGVQCYPLQMLGFLYVFGIYQNGARKQQKFPEGTLPSEIYA